MEKSIQTIETVQVQQRAFLSGYTGEYVFERIRSTDDFYELELLNKWIKNLEHAKVIYDIGANIGNHTIYFALNTNAQIFAFEPMPMNFSLLEKNINDNNMESRIISYNFALGDYEGIAQMEFEQEKNNGTATILPSEKTEINGGVEVKVNILDQMDIPLPDFIKIDVEGFELNVLKGMKNILKMAEASLWIEVDEKNAKLIYEFLTQIGYFVSDFVLSSSNNILFTKQEKNKISSAIVFEHLLIEAAAKRKNWIDIGKQISKYQYEQKKVEDLYRNLQGMVSKYEYERKKVGDLQHNSLEATDVKKQHEKNWEELSAQVEKLQKELSMFQNSKMINFIRFWVWKVPTKFRRWAKKKLYEIGRWLYIKLMPYPRLRLICSKINGKFHIFKNPQAVIAPRHTNKRNYITDNKITDLPKKPKQMNVAMIVDEFTYNSLRFECNVLVLEPHNWKKIFEKNEIDLFFCESAWSGVDSVRRPWKGQIYCSTNFSRENRGVLFQILEYCHSKNIPTAFWNKEDPTHYVDKVHNFVDTALRFNHIFTTANECVERYKKDYGHKSVHLLMFATQPRLFNPVERFERTNEIVFAGSWYNQHKERCVEMESILDAILDSSYPLRIYNRQSENTDTNHTFPSKFTPYLYSRLPHDQLDVAYKGSKYALNINTVTESDTMFARRVFELMSSNTLVISNYSRGMELLFGDNVVFVNGKEKLRLSDVDKKRENCLYNVLQHHTYKNRFMQVLNDIDIPFSSISEQVTIIYEVSDLESATSCINHFYKIDWDNKKCILLVEEKCTPEKFQELCIRYNGELVSVCSKHYFNYYDEFQPSQDNDGYVIVANEQLHFDFISKAILHYQYLDQETAVTFGKDRYAFGEVNSVENVLYSKKRFSEFNIRREITDQKNMFSNVYFL